MPLGFQRINERTQRPNAHITFIKPLANSSEADQKIAQDFLERIAAQCYPVMKKNYCYVQALEEFPPNAEFLGRNFNAGEVIQLVLKDRRGNWLGFRFVQMVMMHELAHIKHMNHSRYFWNERNMYAKEMEELWWKGYTGEGLWGRGRDLHSGSLIANRTAHDAHIPEHLCGGTYRRASGRKRKRSTTASEAPKLTYAEREKRRITRKFGKHGEGSVLGENDLIRGALERGRRPTGAPKVAQSKRGRELRASAALARLERATEVQRQQSKTKSESGIRSDDSDVSNGDSEDDFQSLENNPKIKDENGQDLYQVCGDEGEGQDGGQNELDDLRLLREDSRMERENHDGEASARELRTPSTRNQRAIKVESDSSTLRTVSPAFIQSHGNVSSDVDELAAKQSGQARTLENKYEQPHQREVAPEYRPTERREAMLELHQTDVGSQPCPICSLENQSSATLCQACLHVLNPSATKGHWRCGSQVCQGNEFVNAGTADRCGICGGLKPVAPRPIGLLSNAVLRWD